MRVSASVSRDSFKKQRFPFVRRRRYGQTAASRTETGARRVWLKNASTHAVPARAPPSLFFPHDQFIAVLDVRNHQKPRSSQAAPKALYKSAQFVLGISGRCRELRERNDPARAAGTAP